MTTEQSSKPRLVIGGVPEHYNFPWHLMMESDWADGLGVGIDWVDTLGGTGETKALLEAGDLDMAIALTEGMVAAIAAGNPSVILRTYVSTPLQWGVHVSAQSELHSMEDLRGHRFAISRFGSGSHLMAHVLASDLGYSPTNDQFVKVGNLDGAREAMANGEAEIFLWDRSTTSPYVDNGEFRRIGLQPTPWPAFVVVARRDVAAEHGEVINLMLDAVGEKASDLVASEDRVAVVAERYGINPEEVASWFEETEWDCAQPADPAMIARTQERLIELNLIAEPLDPSAYLARG